MDGTGHRLCLSELAARTRSDLPWLPSEPGDPKAVSPLPHLELQLAS